MPAAESEARQPADFLITMLIFILIFFSLFVSFSLYSRKFSNPYKLFFLFGKKGSGKSTLEIKWMIKDLKNGWSVYTDMPDVNIPGVKYFHTLDLAKFSPEKHSAIYLDEVGLSMDNRQFKSFPEGLRDFFALQRKYRCKVVVNSQSYDVDKKVRDRVDGMFLCSNIGNVIGVVRPIKRNVTLVEASANGESRIADNLRFGSLLSWRFTWLPRYHKWFNSFNAPTRELLPSSRIEGTEELRKIARSWNRKK